MIKEEHGEHHYPIRSLCKLVGITRAAYYKWLNHIETANDRLNKQISDRLKQFIKNILTWDIGD